MLVMFTSNLLAVKSDKIVQVVYVSTFNRKNVTELSVVQQTQTFPCLVSRVFHLLLTFYDKETNVDVHNKKTSKYPFLGKITRYIY